MKKRKYHTLITFISIFCLSSAIAEYEPSTQISLPEAAIA